MRIVKNYKDDSINNVFVKNDDGTSLSIKEDLSNAVSSAKEKICIVLESGMTNEIAQMLISSEARKYVVVPNIEEEKYKPLKGSVIAREVKNIKGNYAVIDEKIIFFFDKVLNGYKITNDKAVKTLQHLFLEEFCVNGTIEYIESKTASAPVSFSIPPVYGNGEFLLDRSFESETEVAKLICRAKTAAYTGKAEAKSCSSVYLKNISQNTQFIQSASKCEIYYAPDLPCSVAEDGGKDYILNFDIAAYNTLPERESGRLFAIKTDGVSVGKTYRFYSHKTTGELVGKDVLDIRGAALTVLQRHEEKRKIVTDLRQAEEYGKMDAQTLETRIEKHEPGIFNSNVNAVEIAFDIAVEIPKHRYTKRAEIYQTFEAAKSELSKKVAELNSAAKANGVVKKLDKYAVDVSNAVDIKSYLDTVEKLNKAIDFVNNHGDEDIDESLRELTNKKKKPAVPHLQAKTFKMDIPSNGILYQEKDKYEYVLTSKDNLSAAVQEMQAAGISNGNVQYLSE